MITAILLSFALSSSTAHAQESDPEKSRVASAADENGWNGGGDDEDADDDEDQPIKASDFKSDEAAREFEQANNDLDQEDDDADSMPEEPKTISVQMADGSAAQIPEEWAPYANDISNYTAGGSRGAFMPVRTDIRQIVRLQRLKIPRLLALATYSSISKAKSKRNRKSACAKAYNKAMAKKPIQADPNASRALNDLLRDRSAPRSLTSSAVAFDQSGGWVSGMGSIGQSIGESNPAADLSRLMAAGGAADWAGRSIDNTRGFTGTAAPDIDKDIKLSNKCTATCKVAGKRSKARKKARNQSGGGKKAAERAKACAARSAQNGGKGSSAGGSGDAGNAQPQNPMQCTPQQPQQQAQQTNMFGQPNAQATPQPQGQQCQSPLGQLMQALGQMLSAMQQQKQLATTQTPAPVQDCSDPNYAKTSVLCVCQNDPKNAMCVAGQQFPSGIMTSNGPQGPSSPLGSESATASDGALVGGFQGQAKTASGSATAEGGGGGGGGGGGRGLQNIAGGEGGGGGPSGVPTSVIQGHSGGSGGGAASGGGGGGGGGSGSGGGRSRVPASDGFNLNAMLPRGAARGVVGMTVPARDGMTAPLGPTLFEKISSQYQQQKRNMREDR